MAVVSGRASVSIDTIKRFVVAYYGVEATELVSARRSKTSVRARHVALYLARQLTALSLPQIAEHFDRRDPRWISEAVRRVDARMDRDAELAGEISGLTFALLPARRGAA